MSLTTRVGLLAGASALTLTGASFADNSTEAQDLAAQVAALKAEVAQLKGDNWLTEQRAEEIRGLVQDVLADADTRSSLLQAGMTAGYDDGFVIGSPDGNFSLKLNGQLQVRFIWRNQDDLATCDTNRWGFENSRTKLMFSGNVVNPQWMYYIEGNFYRDGGSFMLEDAWIAHDCGNGITAKLGRFKLPFFRESLVHSMNQLTVERSLLGVGMTQRVQGLAVDYLADQFHFTGAFTNGLNANGLTPYGTTWGTEDNEWAFTGRIEFLAAGTWDQFEDFTSPEGEEQGFLFGAALHYQNQEYGTTAPVDAEVEDLLLTLDGSAEFGGWNLFGAFWYRINDSDAMVESLEPWGFVVQGGVYLAEDLELFGRWEYYEPDGYPVEPEEFSMITIGVNKYWGDHVKWTTDVGYGLDSVDPDGVTGGGEDTITGWNIDSGDEDGQIVFRTQLQLVF